MNSLTQSVTQEIRAEMARQGINRRNLAAQLVWSPYYLGRRLSGEVAWSTDDLEEIASVLRIPAGRFIVQEGAGQ